MFFHEFRSRKDSLTPDPLTEEQRMESVKESILKLISEKIKGESKDIPLCPVGYRWDKATLQCVPKSNKDRVDADQEPGGNGTPGSYDGYNVWGSNGMDGGYAMEVANEAKTCIRCGGNKCRCLSNSSLYETES